MHAAGNILTFLVFYVVASVALSQLDVVRPPPIDVWPPLIERTCNTTQPPIQTYKCSCLWILYQNKNAPSGVYYIVTAASGTVIEVYCEMGLNGGGYTFLSPASLALITDADVQAWFTDRSTFLMRIRKTDGTQPFGVLKQLPQNTTPLKIGLSQNTGGNAPCNANSLGNFLYFGFQNPFSSILGLQINSVPATVITCDRVMNNYIALFPNFAEKPPSTCYFGLASVCNDIISNMLPNPSRRVMPPDYFMFYETQWGGINSKCGCYQQSISPPSTFISVAIGFK